MPKIVVVTGCANGIGRETALEYAKHGAIVCGLDIEKDALERFEKEIRDITPRYQLQHIDVTNTVGLNSSIELFLQKFNKIDVWINNAGIAFTVGILRQPEEAIVGTINLNLIATVTATQKVLKVMQKQGFGTIVNVASAAGLAPFSYLSAYSASKSGLIAFTRAVRHELKLEGSPVELKIFAPGFVDTRMTRCNGQSRIPKWLQFFVSTPKRTANDLVKFASSSKRELTPGIANRSFILSYKLMPHFTTRMAKIFLADTFIDAIKGNYKLPL
jgi:3-hydroxybutyrate dehydrogenase